MGIVVHIVDASISTDAANFKKRSSRTINDVVIEIGGMCNGVTQAVSDAYRSTKDGSIDALMFYGHGVAGVQGVSTGKYKQGVNEAASITSATLDDAKFVAQIRTLASRFSNRGTIVLRGCNVAQGDVGKKLLVKLAKVAGVPIKASDWYQIVGHSNLSGNIVTAFPDGNIQEKTLEGLSNLGTLPWDEGLLLFGVEFGDRLLRSFGFKGGSTM